jgi:hypothetical protein
MVMGMAKILSANGTLDAGPAGRAGRLAPCRIEENAGTFHSSAYSSQQHACQQRAWHRGIAAAGRGPGEDGK